MLEDFINANGLQARLLPYPAKGKLVKCRLFRCSGFDLLAISFASDNLSLEKLRRAANSEKLEEIDPLEAENVTGYPGEFIPPVSVYGVKVLVDSKVMEAEKVRCLVSEEKTLEISPKEILEANDEAEEAELTL